ncbi:MAG: hypothetical protein HYV97_11150 [Bdellovibrio sp.]|nr:hypothetical protein [Bdellovibrio sp.]
MCNEEMGKQRQKWLSVVKQVRDKKLNITALEDFRKNQGLPFNVWLKGEMQPKDEITTAPADLGKLKVNEKGPVAYWDSPCEYHRKQERPIHTAQIFLKGLAAKSLATTIRNFHGMIQLQKAYLFDQNVGPNGTPLLSEFVIPRDETPLLILPKKLVFVMEEEGLFYHLNIDHSGDIQITEPTSNNSNQLSESVACPDYALRPLTQLLNQDKTIYQVAQCRQYTHFGHKYILLIPSGCY